MGATNSQQEASMLTSVSGQMSAAVDGTTSMVSVLGSAVAKYNPASMLLKGGLSVGSTIGNTLGSTIGAGVGMLRGKSSRRNGGDATGAAAESAEPTSGTMRHLNNGVYCDNSPGPAVCYRCVVVQCMRSTDSEITSRATNIVTAILTQRRQLSRARSRNPSASTPTQLVKRTRAGTAGTRGRGRRASRAAHGDL
jgi:hypothetical protein